MRVINERPPLWDEIVRAFPGAVRPTVIFSCGDRIYAPGGAKVPPELMAHEAVHGYRQGDDVEGWWRRYIADPAFRLDEEIPAHAAELSFLLDHAATRRERRFHTARVAKRLASPLYGALTTLSEAKRLIEVSMVLAARDARIPA